MNKDNLLAIAKGRLGIRSDKRDALIMHNLDGVVAEMADYHGVTEFDNPIVQDLIVDYVVWRYQASLKTEVNQTAQQLAMPRNIQFRLHNLVVSGVAKK